MRIEPRPRLQPLPRVGINPRTWRVHGPGAWRSTCSGRALLRAATSLGIRMIRMIWML